MNINTLSLYVYFFAIPLTFLSNYKTKNKNTATV